jgi:hypothetical protein
VLTGGSAVANPLISMQSFACPSQETFPIIDLDPLANGDPVVYDSDVNQPGVVMNSHSNVSTNRAAGKQDMRNC